MQKNTKPAVVYTTCPSLEIAEHIAGELLKRQQAACVNIIPQIISVYIWDEKIQRDEEVAMLIKTQAHLSDIVMETIKCLHPYDVPAGIVFPTDGGSGTFLEWIAQQTKSST